MQRGTSLTKNNSTEGAYPVISGGRVPAFYCDKFNREGETITVAGSGAGAGYVQYWNEPIFVCDAFSIKGCEDVSTKYLYYYLTNLQDKIYATKKGGGVPHVHISSIENFLIPIPHPDIQEEIVRILDNFTNLAAELQAELTARKKQYEYYRDALLTPPFGIAQGATAEPVEAQLTHVEWKTLGEIATVTKLAGFEFTKYVRYSETGNIIALRGLNVKNGQLNLDDVKYIDKSDFSKLNRSKLFINDMLFTYVGTVGQVALVDKNDKYYLAPNVALVRFEDENVYPPFMKFYFQTSFFKKNQIDRYSGESSMKNLTMENIRKFKIPLPPLPVQQRIVHVLDNFDAICADLNIGLPAEIEARKKQYEYYRDKLLSFPRNKISA